MKRWTTLVGRFGTVLIAVSLALLLISLIPAREQTYSSYSSTLQPSHFSLSGPSEFTLNPQQGIHVTMNSSDELKVYTVQSDYSYISNWLSHNVPAGNYSRMWETSMLEAFFVNHSDIISYQQNVTGEGEFEYIPTMVEQAILISANYGNKTVTYEYQISIINMVASSMKMLMTAEIIIPIGLVLSAPWFISSWKEKHKQQ
jgi:hypothetical protein